jgi:hypothetical protein
VNFWFGRGAGRTPAPPFFPIMHYGTEITREELENLQCLPNWVLIRLPQSPLDETEVTKSGLFITWLSSRTEARRLNRPLSNLMIRGTIVALPDEFRYVDPLKGLMGFSGDSVGYWREVDTDDDLQIGDEAVLRATDIQEATTGSQRVIICEGAWYVMVWVDALVLVIRKERVLPVNGHYIVRPTQRQYSGKVQVLGKGEPDGGIIVHEPMSIVFKYADEVVRTTRITRCGYKPRYAPVTKEEVAITGSGTVGTFRAVAVESMGGNDAMGTFLYHDHGDYTRGHKIAFSPEVGVPIDFSWRREFDGLVRMREKDIAGRFHGNRLVPNRGRVKVLPEAPPDYFERMKNLEVPLSHRSLPRRGKVLESAAEPFQEGDVVRFLGDEHPLAPEYITQEDGRTVFIVKADSII